MQQPLPGAEPSRSEPDHRSSERGLTLPEMLVAVAIVGLLAALATVVLGNQIHKARMAKCHAELRGIRDTIYDYALEYGHLPDEQALWQASWKGRKPGAYRIFVDGDADSGHGNDIDFYDEHNTGANPQNLVDIDFVVLCEHDHSTLAKYVYVVDDNPPTLALAGNDPGWSRLLTDKPHKHKKPKSK